MRVDEALSGMEKKRVGREEYLIDKISVIWWVWKLKERAKSRITSMLSRQLGGWMVDAINWVGTVEEEEQVKGMGNKDE